MENKKNITLAIIITLYNSQKYIELLLNSIVNQTKPFDEVIIIDHGSSDSCYKRALEYSSKINLNIKSLRLKENQGGPAWPRNEGIRIAQSDYVCFNDPDDISLINRCEEIKKGLSEGEADILIHSFQIFREKKDEEKIIKLGRQIKNDYLRKDSINKLYFNEVLTPVGSYTLKRNKLNKVLFREEEEIIGGEDRVILLDLLLMKCKIVCIKDVLLLYNYGIFDNQNKKFRSSLTNRNNTIKISKYIINNFKNNFGGRISPRFLISLYYSNIILLKFKILFNDLSKYGLKNNLKVALYIFIILIKRIIKMFIFNFKSNEKYISKFLLKDYKFFR